MDAVTVACGAPDGRNGPGCEGTANQSPGVTWVTRAAAPPGG
ncbi:MAG: hypothetical protein ACRDNW_16470 [Trebonia sp.]